MSAGDINSPFYTLPATTSPSGAAVPSQADVSGGSSAITAQNANQSTGTATAGSTAALGGNGKATASVEITANTLNVALIPQGSLDGLTWFNLGPLALYNQATGIFSATIAAAATGIWTVGIADIPYFRLTTPNSAVTGSATVLLNASATQAVVASEVPSYTPKAVTANTLVKTGAGVLHALTVSATAAAAVAGLLTVYDNTAASGTVLYQEYITTGVLAHGVVLDVAFSTGLYVAVAATSISISAAYL